MNVVQVKAFLVAPISRAGAGSGKALFPESLRELLFLFVTVNLFAVVFSSAVLAQTGSNIAQTGSKPVPLEPASVEADFREQVITINRILQQKQSEFSQSPVRLVAFVDEHLLSLWGAPKTLRGLLGKSIWKKLTEDNKDKLVQAFNNTLQRYVQEGFNEYDGQKIEFVRVRLNKKRTRGLLTLKVIPNLLPDFNIDLKIARHTHRWLLYDVMVQGVSYISMKKDSFRKLHAHTGIDGVINKYHRKNKGFLPSQLSVIKESSLDKSINQSLLVNKTELRVTSAGVSEHSDANTTTR